METKNSFGRVQAPFRCRRSCSISFDGGRGQNECATTQASGLGRQSRTGQSTPRQTAAALRHQSQVIRQKERAIERVKQAVQLYQPWLTYFDQLIDLVSSQQHEAIANFTREYGPRTSVIQRRLRAVYGFDEIDIRSYESTIRVRVKRASEETPSDQLFQPVPATDIVVGSLSHGLHLSDLVCVADGVFSMTLSLTSTTSTRTLFLT